VNGYLATTNKTSTVSVPAITTAPVVTGTAQQNQLLTSSNGSWSNSPTSYSYQWQDCETTGANCTNISSATSSSYMLSAGDVGHTVRATVTATNSAGSNTTNSATTATVTEIAPAAAFSFSPSSPVTGQNVHLDGSASTCANAPCTYSWDDDGTDGAGGSNWPLGTGQTLDFTFTQAATKYVRLTVTDSLGGTATIEHDVVVNQSTQPPANTTAPAVTGTAQQSQILTTTNGSWSNSPTSFSYQWKDCDSSGNNCTNVPGATSSSYTLASGDVSHTIRAVVTATNAGGSTSQASAATTSVASSSGTPKNCLGTTGSGVISYASLDACGYPSPNTTGVPAGTTLTSVSSISCTNKTINAVSTTGSVSIGSNCTITNSRMTGGQITVQSGVTNVQLTHDEISGHYTGTPTNPTCTYNSSTGSGGATSAILWEGAASGLTLNYDYLHCAAEPFNGNGTVQNSYIIADECWGPCMTSSTTHNEAAYIPGGGSGGTVLDHNTLLNPYSQTAGVFGDDHAWGPISNLTVNNNLVAAGGDNGAIATGDTGDGNSNVKITNNRLSYVYSNSMPTGGDTAASWSGNYRDDTLASVGVSS
jgi:hypothetical protein